VFKKKGLRFNHVLLLLALQVHRKARDMFVFTEDGELIPGESPEKERNLRQSQCAPMFMACYQMRGAGAVIHTHSKAAVLVTLLYSSEFRISHMEMIKGIKKGSSQTNYRKLLQKHSGNILTLALY
jgi:ribulose-5-phosphate 4-epimerase/fuculose-1-phosphate aldolase